MSTASESTIHAPQQVVKDAPVGTNLAPCCRPYSAVPFSRAPGPCFPPFSRPASLRPRFVAVGRLCGAWNIADLVQSRHSYI